ncbi:hypothetical protein N9987_00755 [bacterium]|nr:hypothetical protein [bacterium]
MDSTDFDWPHDDIVARIREIDELNPPPGFTNLNPNRFVPTHRRGRRRRPRRVRLYQDERRNLARSAAQIRAENRRQRNEDYTNLYNQWNQMNTDIRALVESEWPEFNTHMDLLRDLEIQRNNLRNQLEDF